MAHKGSVGTRYANPFPVQEASASFLLKNPSLKVSRIHSLEVRHLALSSVMFNSPDKVLTVNPLVSGAAPVSNVYAKRYVQGTVKEQGVLCRRLLRVYRRDNGALLASGYSDLPGSRFHISWSGYAGQVFIIAFDDLGINPDFNCQVYDLITPS